LLRYQINSLSHHQQLDLAHLFSFHRYSTLQIHLFHLLHSLFLRSTFEHETWFKLLTLFQCDPLLSSNLYRKVSKLYRIYQSIWISKIKIIHKRDILNETYIKWNECALSGSTCQQFCQSNLHEWAFYIFFLFVSHLHLTNSLLIMYKCHFSFRSLSLFIVLNYLVISSLMIIAKPIYSQMLSYWSSYSTHGRYLLMLH
jgi:hypothetical protein